MSKITNLYLTFYFYFCPLFILFTFITSFSSFSAYLNKVLGEWFARRQGLQYLYLDKPGSSSRAIRQVLGKCFCTTVTLNIQRTARALSSSLTFETDRKQACYSSAPSSEECVSSEVPIDVSLLFVLPNN